jgi:hypothetical protein
MSSPLENLQVILLGASGMVGAAVLDECLNDPRVTQVLALGRSPSGRSHPKLTDLVHQDLWNLGPVAGQLKGYNSCLYTLGVSSVGMSEADYTRVTYDLTLSVAKALLDLNPGLSICYVSGESTDETEQGKTMWARVKGRTENALLALPFRQAVMIRLGGLQALPGYKSKTRLYRVVYALFGPLVPLLVKLFPEQVLTPHILGQAMIRASLGLTDKKRLPSKELYALGRDA